MYEFSRKGFGAQKDGEGSSREKEENEGAECETKLLRKERQRIGGSDGERN